MLDSDLGQGFSRESFKKRRKSDADEEEGYEEGREKEEEVTLSEACGPR
jgi:hypothetical protein